jgi:hypothetical protein
LFANLRVLSLAGNAVGRLGMGAIAASPCEPKLRILSFRDNDFGPAGLSGLFKPGAFPNLTTLDLCQFRQPNASIYDVTNFLQTLHLPRLRHLDLHHWPVDDQGAEALAANPTFANLTRLNLAHCQIGPVGAQALFASPHLQRLIALDLSHNPAGWAVEDLLDRGVMPHLQEFSPPSRVPGYLEMEIKAARPHL